MVQNISLSRKPPCSQSVMGLKKKKLYFVMVTMSRLNRDFQWAIRDKQSLLRARFLHLIMRHVAFTPICMSQRLNLD